MMDGYVNLNERLKIIDDAIAKKKMIADGHPVGAFTSAERMIVYDCVYALCTQRSTGYSDLVYEKYHNCLAERIQEKVLPKLTDKKGTELLTEVMRLWSEYEEFASFLSKLFSYLEKYYIPRRGLPSLADSQRYYFCNMVCDKLYGKMQEAVMTLIIQEREGEQIDQNQLQAVLNFFLKVGGDGITNYYEKFEQAMLAEAAAFYSQLSLEWWFWCDSFSNYLRKTDWCLNQEDGRAQRYPCQTTRTKLLEVMKYVLLERNAKKWALKQEAEGLAAEDQDLLSKYARLSLQ